MNGQMTREEQFTRIVTTLGGESRHEWEFLCHCPSHDDGTPSLKVDLKNDKILLRCYAGCEQNMVIAALRERGLWHASTNGTARTPPGIPVVWPTDRILQNKNLRPGPENQRQFVQCWPWKAEDGTIDGFTVLYFGRGKKDVVPFFKKYKDTARWSSGIPKEKPRPIYARDVIASNPEAMVWIVEGERKAEILIQHGRVATTWPGGARSWNKADWSPLRGRSVRLWPDKDIPGRGAMQGIANMLVTQLGCAAELVEIENMVDLGDSDDVVDWFSKGHSAAELDALPTKVFKSRSKTFPLTELGNAERFADQHRNFVKYCPEFGQYLTWDGRIWNPSHSIQYQLAKKTVRSLYVEAAECEEDKLRDAILRHARESEKAAKIQAMLFLAQKEKGIEVKSTDLDRDLDLFNAANGTVDLRTGALRRFNPKDLITRISPTEYRIDAVCPRWEAFLSEIFMGDVELIEFVQRFAGYCLTGHVSERCIAILWGSGSNGKSTLVEILSFVMGENYAWRVPTDALMKSKGDRHPTEIAGMRGKRFVRASESEHGRKLAEALIKDLSGNETLTARFMRQDFFQFKPEFKLVLSSNYKPEIVGSDSAIWSRIHLIPFLRSFAASEQDKQLDVKLKSEAPGILRWMVEGAIKWYQVGLGESREVREATTSYREDMDIIARFLEESCDIGEAFDVKVKDLWEAFSEWLEMHGSSKISKGEFSKRLRGCGFAPAERRTAGVWYWSGLTLKQSSTPRSFTRDD